MGDTLFAVHLSANLGNVSIGFALNTVSTLYVSDDWSGVSRVVGLSQSIRP